MFKTRKKLTPIEVELLDYFNSMKSERNLEVLEQSVNLFNVFYGEFNVNPTWRTQMKKVSLFTLVLIYIVGVSLAFGFGIGKLKGTLKKKSAEESSNL